MDPDKLLAVQIDVSSLTNSVKKTFCLNTIMMLLLCMKIKHNTLVKLNFCTV